MKEKRKDNAFTGDSIRVAINGLGNKRREWQRRAADKMQQASNRVPVAKKKRLVAAIVLLACLLLGYQVWNSFGINTGTEVAGTGKIKMPRLPDNDWRKVDTRAYKHILNFERYLDSLDKTPEGRRIIEELIQKRPGLLDSLVKAKRLFEREHKK
ncbi:hypothetical protein [Pedobacter panaciterrae]|uniref:hypothetical protein n=1 Tax=Pedobacter panaciterrae TaxID=363849 RepID=UPI002591F0DB|nr:hypothetical protein [uncultured Pedobacter sp.]